jgi:hypothetical protein
MARRSLSPRRVAQKLREHHHAVITLALHRAKGLKLSQFSAKEIALLAEAEFERNRARLIAEAEHSINTWPGFARRRLPPEVFVKSQKPNTRAPDSLRSSGRTK